MLIRTWVFDRIKCRWTLKWLTKAAWKAMPHLTSAAIGACIAHTVWLKPAPPRTSGHTPGQIPSQGGFPPQWQTPPVPAGLLLPPGPLEVSPGDVGPLGPLFIANNTQPHPKETPPKSGPSDKTPPTPPKNVPEPNSAPTFIFALVCLLVALKLKRKNT